MAHGAQVTRTARHGASGRFTRMPYTTGPSAFGWQRLIENTTAALGATGDRRLSPRTRYAAPRTEEI